VAVRIVAEEEQGDVARRLMAVHSMHELHCPVHFPVIGFVDEVAADLLQELADQRAA
jgi:hypothetical protein